MKLPSEIKPQNVAAQLEQLESQHHILDMYLWLANRFDNFVDKEYCLELKTRCEKLISICLFLSNRSEKQARARTTSNSLPPQYKVWRNLI
jgi:hypothetical protein